MLDLLVKGLIIGFAIAAPVGPIGVLCIKHSLHDGFKSGLITGLGAASADGIYGLIAGFGLTAISSVLVEYQFWIRLIGGLFLLYLGLKLLLTPYHESTELPNSDKKLFSIYTKTFLLTLTNPMTILSFTAIFAGLGLGSVHTDYIQAILLVLGIIIGSGLWWIILSSSVALILRHRISSNRLKIINKISGLIVFIFGIFAILKM